MTYSKYPTQVLKIICINLVRLITLMFGPAAIPPSGLSYQSVHFTREIYFLLPRRQTGDGTLKLAS